MNQVSDIKQSAIKIQNCFRTCKFNKLIKNFRELDLNILANSIPFSDFTQVIRKKEPIISVKNIINLLNNYFKDLNLYSQYILSSYLITFYQKELFSKEKHPSDIGIIEWATEVTKFLDEYQFNNINIIKKFWLLLKNYKVIFDQWKNMDKNKTVEKIIISYYYRSESIDKITQDKKIDKQQKSKIIAELEIQRNNLLSNIKKIDPSIDIKYIKENYKLLFKNINKMWNNMYESLSKNMKKAYNTLIVKEAEKGNTKNLYNLFMEINKRLLLIIPENKKISMSHKLNGDIVTNLLKNKTWTPELKEYINFILNLVKVLGAPVDDKKIDNFKNNIENLMKDNFYQNLTNILINIQEKIDRIYDLILKLNK